MARVEITGIAALLKGIDQEIDRMVQETADAYESTARAKTPIKTGNARRNWRQPKRANKRGFDVENRVPYIERLEEGSSRQAPRGIIGPTLDTVKRRK